jgi:uncharacterized membrane protein
MKKFDKKFALGFGLGIIVYCLIRDLWMMEVYTINGIAKMVIGSIICGVLGAVFFGFTAGWYKPAQKGK